MPAPSNLQIAAPKPLAVFHIIVLPDPNAVVNVVVNFEGLITQPIVNMAMETAKQLVLEKMKGPKIEQAPAGLTFP